MEAKHHLTETHWLAGGTDIYWILSIIFIGSAIVFVFLIGILVRFVPAFQEWFTGRDRESVIIKKMKLGAQNVQRQEELL